MLEVGSGPKNKIELESQVLCTSLRQSWGSFDSQGAINSAQELCKLFPDLLPATTGAVLDNYPRVGDDPVRPGRHGGAAAAELLNHYQLLGLEPNSTATEVLVEYLRRVRLFLRKGNVKTGREEFSRMLDAGFILRKPRLRISHDLVMVRNWLIKANVVDSSGTFKPLSTSAIQSSSTVTPETSSTQLPKIVMLLNEAQFIGAAEIQALEAQMTLAPEIPVERLILDSGYVSQAELISLKLAEMLLEQGKISMAQFQVAMYDERTSGVRMAESLQIRGWLPVEVSPSQEERRSKLSGVS